MTFPKDGKQRSYMVLFHFREGSNGPQRDDGTPEPQYDLDVRATNAERAINKVIAENLGGDYGITKRDIVIDEVVYNPPDGWVATYLARMNDASKRHAVA